MCFSASASFGAAVVLGGVGAWSVRGERSWRRLPLASVPFLFAVQQLVEGLLWRILERSPYYRSSTDLARVFLFFALFLWPSYLPLSLTLLERDRRRRAVLVGATVVGTLLGAYLMGCAVLRPVHSCVALQHIYYSVQIDAAFRPATSFVYGVAIVVPLLVSSVRGTSWFAAATVVSFTVAGALFRTGFASVWCFFAAVLSVAIHRIVEADRRATAE